MTATLLLGWISAAIVLQVVVGIGVAVWRQRRPPKIASDTARDIRTPLPSGAWAGWREFRVARRSFEDEVHSQCSFHLEPVDGVALPPFKPGQFLTFQLAIEDQDRARRWRRQAVVGANARLLLRAMVLPDPQLTIVVVWRFQAQYAASTSLLEAF